MLQFALTLDGPVSIRWPSGVARSVPDDQVGHGLAARLVRSDDGGGEVCILAVGKLVEAAEEAAEKLEAEGINATVWDMRIVKPLDPEMLADAARHALVVTAEDGLRLGGAGSAVADALGTGVLHLGLPDRYIPQGKSEHILASLGLDGPGIAESVKAALTLQP
jgi:1-deoxy-D-xylulose-5-phosphate synthase